jgi:hypothetical protein
LQTLSTIGGVIGWLFASTKSGAPNGFVITGINIINKLNSIQVKLNLNH